VASHSEIHVELLPIVDEFMRIEHELLQMALAKDRGKKYKKPKEKKQRKGKKGKKKKKREPKDITADKTIEELYAELKDMRVIRKYEKRRIDELVGDLNYLAYDKRNVAEE
jgi:IQ and AAA domain-containing protein